MCRLRATSMPDILMVREPATTSPHASRRCHPGCRFRMPLLSSVICRSRRRRRRRASGSASMTTCQTSTSTFILAPIQPIFCSFTHSLVVDPAGSTDVGPHSPSRPTPVSYVHTYTHTHSYPSVCMPVVPTPVLVSRLHRSGDCSTGQRAAAAESGSGIEPMIPGAHACAQAFPLHSRLQPGADNSLLDGYTQLPPKGCAQGPSQHHALLAAPPPASRFSFLSSEPPALLCFRE